MRVTSTQKLPTVVAAERCEGAHQREGHRQAGRGGQEVVHGEAEHLREMTHRRLAAVVLPVGVGDEADRRVEREIRRHRVEPLRIERQTVLQPLQRVERQRSRRSRTRSSRSHRRTSSARASRRRRRGGRTPISTGRSTGDRKLRSPSVDRHRSAGSAGIAAASTRSEHDRDLRPADECHGVTFGFEAIRISRDGSGCRGDRPRATRRRPVRSWLDHES